jgi:hypothetical protein
MPARSKVLRYRAIGSEEALRVSWGCEPLHAPLPLARGLLGVLRTVVEVAVLAMFHPWQSLPLRRAVAFQLVRNDRARHIP